MESHRVTFYPGRRSVTVPSGTTIWEAANRLSVAVLGPCGGQGKCGRCRVVCDGLTGDEGREKLSRSEWDAGIRLACQTRIYGDLEIVVPSPDTGKIRTVSSHAPIPSGPLSPMSAPIHQGDMGIALDIGTTTVALSVLDLTTGEEVASASDYNRQILIGEDVLSRIEYSEDEGPQRLQKMILETVNDLILKCSDDPYFHRRIKAVCIAGNTTMSHLFLGIDPSPIRYEPFVPVVRDARLNGRDSGLLVSENADVEVMPSVSSYVGGDVTSDILHSGMDLEKETGLLIDVGTNGEVVLGNREFLISASSSAGPSFEGGDISCGMRASPGAIEGVSIDAEGRFSTRVVGDVRPKGICGSGLIDVLAEMHRHGIIDRKGRFTDKASTEERDGSLIVHITDRDAGVFISEEDIQSLMRTKGAILSACRSLLINLGMDFLDVDKMYVCGGFGRYLDLENSISIGLLPDLPREKFSYLGNSSLAGTKMALLREGDRKRVGDIADRLTYLDLSNDATFFQEYSSALFLPHTDMSLFPSQR